MALEALGFVLLVAVAVAHQVLTERLVAYVL